MKIVIGENTKINNLFAEKMNALLTDEMCGIKFIKEEVEIFIPYEEVLNNGFRSYEDQQKAYNTQVNEKGSTEEADKVSSRPGHSEHQLGNTADINSLKTTFADTTEDNG